MKQIKSYEDACKKLGIDPNNLPDVSMLEEKHRKHIIASIKLIRIAEAINDGWVPDWTNYGQYKYYAWFYMEKKKSGFGLSCSGYVGSVTATYVGSRLVFEKADQAKYFGETFLDLHKDYLLFT